MSFIEILETLLLKPLQLVFEIIYAITDRMIGNPGASIIVLSLVINFLVLPLYRRADAMQEEQRQIEMRLQKGVAHIKKTFSGDEQMLMLRTYYRQNNYKPTYALRGATSLFLEIPFFIAAYRFLSGLQLLKGVPFGPIADLGGPDGMLQIAGMSINVLPFVMTAVNLASCIIFTKDSPAKTKVQLYGMAVFFLIFLYASPSGLVLYWTMNNIFSLVKTIFYKLKNPRRILSILSSVVGIGVAIYGIFRCTEAKALVFLGMLALLMQVPVVYVGLKRRNWLKVKLMKGTPNKAAFLSGGIFLSVLTGVLIPSGVISLSPQEFVSSVLFYHPVWFIVSSFCMAVGVFVIWMGVFYWLAAPTMKLFFDRVVWILSGILVINYMFFSKNFGNLASNLRYENPLGYKIADQVLNLFVIMVAALIFYVIYERFEKRVYEVLVIGIVAFVIMSIPNIMHINSSMEIVRNRMTGDREMPSFDLSKSGKNVIVLMLDRAVGEQIPYIFDERPELKEQFAGFTYYSNTISFGRATNFGAPALFGGYEYTPIEMNKRSEEPLALKHNEALKVMPALFDSNDYKVTVCNPVYAGYQWTPDLRIYDEYPDVKRYNTDDLFMTTESMQVFIENDKRNFFCYSMLKTMPLCVQKTIYNSGKYNQLNDAGDEVDTGQIVASPVKAEGLDGEFMEHYNVLKELPNFSTITDEEINTFLLMVNNTTHQPMLLQKPDYEPSFYVDNTEYEEFPLERVLNGRTLKLEEELQNMHYHVNMAAMLQLGEWFDYMRKEGVYDNTRIILVADHGWYLYSLDDLVLDDNTCLSQFYPLLMVKDFGSKEFTTSDEFMTNADVPTIATEGIIDHPTNPFTGKAINSEEKTAHDQYIIDSVEWNIEKNNGNTFLPGKWYSVHDNIWDKSNWELVAEDAVLSTVSE